MDPALSKDRYRRLTNHFQHCIDLPPGQRDEYVARITVEDPDMGLDLQSLLRHHQSSPEPATPPPAPAASGAPAPSRIRRNRKKTAVRILLIAGLVIALIVLVGQLWALNRLEETIRRDGGQGLRAALDVRIAGVRRWSKEKKRHVRRILDDPALAEPISALAETAREPGGARERLLSGPHYREVVDRIRRALEESGDRGFTILSPAGIVI